MISLGYPLLSCIVMFLNLMCLHTRRTFWPYTDTLCTYKGRVHLLPQHRIYRDTKRHPGILYMQYSCIVYAL
ncbi:hypothetical protein BDW02DRAFT_134998 [Decorospora gaudefroyi]|uniref:Uncharacterized protein n=1 Tax=Decorospora gaudefroyi TaxID=184978 RepID=A0A6A5JZ59_9PLEO|nr:hypothetical protein BDW02DRAFT_134998 [Decorospora gaudefroyi]